MTDRKKAIEVLRLNEPMQKTHSLMETAICIAKRESYLTDEEEATLREAVDMGIKALEQEPCDHYTEGYFKGYDDGQKGKLEQEPCEDAISRSDAIRVASGYCHWSNIPKELAKLPSVNPIQCEDVISRQAAINAVRAGVFSAATLYGRSEKGETARKEIERLINALPSVSTEKTGRWFIDERPESDREVVCSNCDQPIFKYHKLDFDYRPKYCSNCGAKMEVEE